MTEEEQARRARVIKQMLENGARPPPALPTGPVEPDAAFMERLTNFNPRAPVNYDFVACLGRPLPRPSE